MQIKYKYNSLYLNTDYFDKTKQPIIFLHGFSGSSTDWLEILPDIHSDFSPIAIDLIGHGKSSSPSEKSDYTVQAIIEQINFLLKHLKIENPVFVGYSMGGRAVLSYTVNNLNVPKALILESSTPGIDNNEEKNKRIFSDNDLSEKILESGIQWFSEYWKNIPLFESQKKLSNELHQKIKKEKLSQNPAGLALSLQGFGTGKMPSMWNQLKKIKQKTLLITGSLDEKFSKINKTVNEQLTDSEHKIIRNAGHNTHLEKPEEFTILVNNFLKNL